MHCNRTLVPFARQIMLELEQPHRTFFWRPYYSPWGLVNVSKQMEDIERTFARMERDMNVAFRDFGRFGNGSPFCRRGFFGPNSGGFVPVVEGETVPGEGGVGGKYVVKMNLGKTFDPKNVKVTLTDRVLTIDAKFEQKSEDGASRMYQELCKSFTLPENVKVEDVKSLFTPEGELLIEAPLPVVEAPKPKEIPITVKSK